MVNPAVTSSHNCPWKSRLLCALSTPGTPPPNANGISKEQSLPASTQAKPGKCASVRRSGRTQTDGARHRAEGSRENKRPEPFRSVQTGKDKKLAEAGGRGTAPAAPEREAAGGRRAGPAAEASMTPAAASRPGRPRGG